MLLASLRHNRLFRAAAWLSLWLLLFPALVPLVHHPAMAGDMSSMPNCPMAMGGMDGNHGTPDPAKSQAPCPICQSLSILAHGFVAPPEIAVAAQPFVYVFATARSETAPVFRNLLSPWPRGPPVLA